jgi:hypothetical protein
MQSVHTFCLALLFPAVAASTIIGVPMTSIPPTVFWATCWHSILSLKYCEGAQGL